MRCGFKFVRITFKTNHLTKMISFKGYKPGMLFHKNQLHPHSTTYTDGKPVSFLGFDQNESKYLVNLRGKPRFLWWCNVSLQKSHCGCGFTTMFLCGIDFLFLECGLPRCLNGVNAWI